MRAKTGTPRGVSGLSGVVTSKGGMRALGFSLLINKKGKKILSVRQRHTLEEVVVKHLLR